MSPEDKLNLLNQVKSYLNITWDEEDSDIQNMIDRAISYMSAKGINVDFVNHTVGNQLLLDRCRFVRNYRSEEFENMFLSDILALQIATLPTIAVPLVSP